MVDSWCSKSGLSLNITHMEGLHVGRFCGWFPASLR